MVGINDRAIVDALEETTNMMTQANEAFQANQYQNSGANEFRGMGKFQRNNPHTFKGRYNPEDAQRGLQEIEKIFRVMVCTNAHKVLFGTHMLSEEVKCWWDNSRK